MKKQAISAALAGTMLVGTMAAPAMAVSVDQFTDIKTTDWFYPYVQKVAEKDYMIGVGGNLFAPTTEMSRAMFVTVLARLEGVKEESAKSNFDDVPDNTWYTSAVNWAAENGIVEGNGAGKFMPEDEITRQDMCTMMARYVTYHQKKHNVTHVKPGTEKTFTDEDQIASYAAEFVEQCVAWGLIEGNDLGQFMPKSFATRAEAAAVISRLSWRSNSGGGGGGGGGTVTKTADYTVTVDLKADTEAIKDQARLSVNYDDVTIKGSNVTGDQTFDNVVNDLVGENENQLSNYISQALNKIKGKSVTQTIDGRQATITISDAGVISATVSVKVTEITGGTQDGMSVFATQAELEDLINKLQSGEPVTFTKADMATMSDLLKEIDKVNEMPDEDIQTKINEIVADRPELEQLVDGMTPAAVKEAAKDYQTQVAEIQKEILDKAGVGSVDELADDFVSEEITREVLMNLDVDLGAYYDTAVKKFTDNQTRAINRLKAELEKSGEVTWDQAKAEAVYAQGNPANYVTKNADGTLSLKAVDGENGYVELVQDSVSVVADFYASLKGDEAFYQDLLGRLESKYKEGYDVYYSDNFVTDMATLLGDSDGIFVNDETAFREGMTFYVEVKADEDTYGSWLDLITGKFDQADILPDTMPSALNKLLGDYTLTFTIDKTA